MESGSIPLQLAIGILGALIGALLVYLGQTGFVVTRAARTRAKERWGKEVELWESRDLGARQGLTNRYLFAILRYLFLGNLLWLVANFIEAPMELAGARWEAYLVVTILLPLGSVICFFLGLGSIVRYLRLRAKSEVL